MNVRKNIGLALPLAFLAATTACEENEVTISRVQPNAIDKNIFEGVWYTRVTTIDTDPESLAFEGLTTDMEKIRWDITDELLVAYRTYEFVPYAEGLTDEGRDFFGAPVAAFSISSHFDIQRDYNRRTGVPTNALVENDTDRPWHERRFMRVDWSQNLVGGPTLIGGGSLDALYSLFSQGEYFVQDNEPTNPDRPFITQDYIDFVNVYSMEPSPTYCFFQLLFQSTPRCGLSNTKVRLSFRKVDPSDDYESLYYPDMVEYRDDEGNALLTNSYAIPCTATDNPGSCEEEGFAYDARFGNFRINRVAFSNERFLTRSGRIYMAGRYDLWEDSFDETGAVRPYEQRVPKPVIYYNTVTTPSQITEAAHEIGSWWNEPFTETTAYLMGYRTAGDKQADVDAFLADFGEALAHPDFVGVEDEAVRKKHAGMFQMRENDCNKDNIIAYAEANNLTSVIERTVGGPENILLGNLENVCAAMQWEELQRGKTLDPKVAERTGREMAFQWQREGDLRYSMSNYINQVQGGPWGIAQFGQDPETGEFVANNANYFSNAGDLISQRSVDQLQWTNGDLSDEELMRGQYVRDIVLSNRAANGYDLTDEIKSALAPGNPVSHKASNPATSGGSGDRSGSVGVGGLTDSEKYEVMFAGSELEREFLITDDILRAFAGPSLFSSAASQGILATGNTIAGRDVLPAWARQGGIAASGATTMPGSVGPEAYAEASPLNWAFVDNYNVYSEAVTVLGGQAWDMADFFDPVVDGLANEVKGWEREDIFDFLQTNLFKAVQAHEVGHAVGLRHNFEGSMDPINYRPEFWDQYFDQLEDGLPTPENSVRSQEYKYASVMDYGFDFTINGWHGLGSYDQAAIRFMYGQLIDAWDPEKVSLPDPRRYGEFARHCGVTEGFVGKPNLELNTLVFFTDPRHLPQIFGNAPVTPDTSREECAALPADACMGAAGTDFDTGCCNTELDDFFQEMADFVGNTAEQLGIEYYCGAGILAWNPIFEALEGENDLVDIPSKPTNLYEGRMLRTVDFMIQQERSVLANQPERDDAMTEENEATNGIDDDGDGIPDDKGYDWGTYVHAVDYAYCTDIFAGFSNPFCQRWDAGWDFEEQIQNHVTRYDRDFLFDHFRRDRDPWYGFGNPNAYLSRVIFRRFKPMTDVFQYFLFTRETAFAAPRYDDWRAAAIKGLNFLERILNTPEPGTYCLGSDNVYRLEESLAATETCSEPYELNTVGYGGGAYLGNLWDEQYYFNTTVLGSFWDKLAAILLLTRSTGFLQFDLSAIFDRRAFSLPYIRVFRDPVFQRFSALIRGDFEGYRPRLVPEVDENGEPILGDDGEALRFVEPIPFLAGEYPIGHPREGENIRTVLTETDENGDPLYPAIEPAWDYTLRLYALAFGLSNWSGADYAIDYYRLTKVAIEGLPGFTDFVNSDVVSFEDPETLLEYQAPIIPPFREPTLLPLIPEAFYGDRASRNRGEFHEWSVAAELVNDLNEYTENVYMPRLDACVASAGGEEPTLATTPECTAWEQARTRVADEVGFLNMLRKFTERAEGIFR